jgi:hypothetical protein
MIKRLADLYCQLSRSETANESFNGDAHFHVVLLDPSSEPSGRRITA